MPLAHPPWVSVSPFPRPCPTLKPYPFAIRVCEPAEFPFRCSEVQQYHWKRGERRPVKFGGISRGQAMVEKVRVPRDPQEPSLASLALRERPHCIGSPYPRDSLTPP